MGRTGGAATKEKILDATEQLILEKGFAGATVDLVLEKTGLTKGAFFYHFKSKAELGRGIIDRYVERDNALLHELVSKAEKLSRDPLQQYLIFVGLMEDLLSQLDKPFPGCLIASYAYQMELFDEDTQQAVISGFDEWNRVLREKLEQAMTTQQPELDVTAEALVNNLLSAFEGGVVLGKVYDDAKMLSVQLQHHKNYVELLFR